MTGPNTALSVDRICAKPENLKLFSSTLVRLYRASAPFVRVALCANRIVGFVFTRLTNRQTSRNLKKAFESASLFIK